MHVVAGRSRRVGRRGGGGMGTDCLRETHDKLAVLVTNGVSPKVFRVFFCFLSSGRLDDKKRGACLFMRPKHKNQKYKNSVWYSS